MWRRTMCRPSCPRPSPTAWCPWAMPGAAWSSRCARWWTQRRCPEPMALMDSVASPLLPPTDTAPLLPPPHKTHLPPPTPPTPPPPAPPAPHPRPPPPQPAHPAGVGAPPLPALVAGAAAVLRQLAADAAQCLHPAHRRGLDVGAD